MIDRPHVWIIGYDDFNIAADKLLENGCVCESFPAMHWAYDLLKLQYPHALILNRQLSFVDGDGPYECDRLRQKFGKEFGIIGVEPNWAHMNDWSNAGADAVLLERGFGEHLLESVSGVVSLYDIPGSKPRNRFTIDYDSGEITIAYK